MSEKRIWFFDSQLKHWGNEASMRNEETTQLAIIEFGICIPQYFHSGKIYLKTIVISDSESTVPQKVIIEKNHL